MSFTPRASISFAGYQRTAGCGVGQRTLCFGATYCPDDGQTAAELFHKADDRLFAAKLVRQNRATVVALADAR